MLRLIRWIFRNLLKLPLRLLRTAIEEVGDMLRSRTFATLGIWIVGLFGVQMLLARLTYFTTQLAPQAVLDQYERISQNLAQAAANDPNMGLSYLPYMDIWQTVTVQVDGLAQVMIFAMCFLLMVGVIIASLAIWRAPEAEPAAAPAASTRQSEKVKRDQRERMLRLMERMDEDDLAALEYQLADDGDLRRRG